ncbi:CPBP family intramembrane glutamic endopeptidase [Pseudonocardia sp. CA-107938]|uniref:CPBP family intramembrane glutamic endopeptidase n=1 Tax=Pseudonocardia sp. CA-107938 TaxID=3240021 RepID=UPI003D94EADF
MVTTSPRTAGPTGILTAAGLAVFAAAYGWLLATGTTEVTGSADSGATGPSLLGALLPALVAVLIALVVAPHARPVVLDGVPTDQLRREALVLVGLAVAFPLSVLAVPGDLAYPLLKVGLLLVAPLAAFRLMRGTGPVARTVPRPLVWAAPSAAALAWFLTSHVGPLAVPLTQQLPDPVTLAVVSLVTLLTASVLEEFFYRAWLQTRLERLIGVGPAVVGQALLFAAMHVGHILANTAGIATGVAGALAVQGVFGLMQGVLWARYRNIWVIVAIHVVTNLVYVDLLLG